MAAALVVHRHRLRTSASATGRGGARHLRRARCASTTTIDVILCVSMIFSASTASRCRADGDRARRHRLAGRQRQDVRRAAHEPPQVAVGEHARPAGRSASTTHVMPSRLLDISWITSGIGVAMPHDRGRRRRRASRSRPAAAAVRACRPDGTTRTALRRSPCAPSSVIASASPRASAAVVLAVGTRFIGHASSAIAAVERDVGGPGERRAGMAGQRDQARADPPDRLQQPDHLLGLAAVRQRQHHVVFADGAEIAVDGFRRMEEPGRGAGARERRGNLAADDAGLAHAGDDHASAALVAADRARARSRRRCDRSGCRSRPPRCAGPCGRARAPDIVSAFMRGLASVDLVAMAWTGPGDGAAASSRSSRSAFCASLFARSGRSWTSMKTPSTPAATPAEAIGSMNSACPAVTPSPAPGSCRLCVTS